MRKENWIISRNVWFGKLKNDNELCRPLFFFVILVSVLRIKIIIIVTSLLNIDKPVSSFIFKLNRNKLKTGKRLSVFFIAKQIAITLFKHPRDATETTIQSPQLLSKKKKQCLTNNPFVRSSLNSTYFQINSEFQMQRRVHLRLFKCIRQRTRENNYLSI